MFDCAVERCRYMDHNENGNRGKREWIGIILYLGVSNFKFITPRLLIADLMTLNTCYEENIERKRSNNAVSFVSNLDRARYRFSFYVLCF